MKNERSGNCTIRVNIAGNFTAKVLAASTGKAAFPNRLIRVSSLRSETEVDK